MRRSDLAQLCASLKLYGFADALAEQFKSKTAKAMPFETRLLELLEAQLAFVTDRRINNLRKRANLRWPHASVSSIDYTLHPKLLPSVLESLAACHWIEHHQHVILQGATGTGKTFIACALAQQAILQEIPVLYVRYPDLVLQLLAAQGQGELDKLRRKLNKAMLLVIDDWGVAGLGDAARHLLFELVETRDQNASLLITSQFPVSAWHEAFQDKTIADATLDRIVHSAHQLHLEGESIRKQQGLGGER